MKIVIFIILNVCIASYVMANDYLCGANEISAYSCQLENNKFISICINNNTAIYKYGANKNNIELILSSDNIDFFPKHKSYAKGEERSYKFINGKYTYNVFLNFFSQRDKNGNSYTDEDYGLSVLKNKKEVFRKSCVDLPDINSNLLNGLDDIK